MKKNLTDELNFLQEAENTEKVSKLLTHLPGVRVPKIHWDLSSERILVMEFCKGGKIDDVEYLKKHNIDFEGVSKKVDEMYASMIYKHGYVHCDPHPGNVLVHKTKAGVDEVILLDHGLYTHLTDDFRLNFAHFWLSIFQRDENGIKNYANNLGIGNNYRLFACMVTGRSWRSILNGINTAKKNRAESKEIKEKVAKYLKEITKVLATDQMILILKTGDLLRNIHLTLGTQESKRSHFLLLRMCNEVSTQAQLKQCSTRWCQFKITFHSHWNLMKLSIFEHLWLFWSKLHWFSIKMLGY